MPFQLPTQEEKHDYVHEQFERIAERYDLTNDAISLGLHRTWKKLAVDLLLAGSAPKVTEERLAGRYLDVCCGTGDLAIRVAERLKPEGEVVGLDFSGGMLSVAKTRSARLKNGKQSTCKISWIEGDALHLPFPDNSFDGAIISFGLRNLIDLQGGLAEMARVVKPGGVVVNLDLGRPQGILFKPAFSLFFRWVVPIIGLVLQNDKKAYTYLPESMNTYPEPAGITKLFEQAGMNQVRHVPLSGSSVALHTGVVV